MCDTKINFAPPPIPKPFLRSCIKQGHVHSFAWIPSTGFLTCHISFEKKNNLTLYYFKVIHSKDVNMSFGFYNMFELLHS